MSPVSQELLSYLSDTITPTHVGGETLIALDLDAVDWESISDGYYCGLIGQGTPTPEQVEHIWRVVKPGAHVLLIAPPDMPTGHEGACALEDRGFEIRDAILLYDTPVENGVSKLHYVPKANGRERNDGTKHLAVKRQGIPLYEVRAQYLEDETVMAEIEAALTAAGVPSDQIDAVADMGILKNKIPKEVLGYFSKKEGSDKYGNLHPCLHPDALVMAIHGYRPIREVQIGDMVYSADGRFHAVEHVSNHPYTSPALFEIAICGTNATTLVTDNHPYLIFRAERTKKGNITSGNVMWVRADQINVGDYTLTSVLAEPTHLPSGRMADPEFWFMVGLYTAEGVLQTSGNSDNVYPSFTLGEHETTLIERVKTYFEPFAKTIKAYPKTEGKAFQVIAFDAEAGALFSKLVGKGSSLKRFDSAIWSLPLDHRKALLEGYLAGDGSAIRTYQGGKDSVPRFNGTYFRLGRISWLSSILI